MVAPPDIALPALPQPAAPALPGPEEVARAVGVRQAEEALHGLRSHRDELLASIADAERRLADLQQQALALSDLDDLRRVFEAVRGEVATARGETELLRRDAADAAAVVRDTNQQVDAARVAAEAVRATADETTAAVARADDQAHRVRADVDRTLGGIETIREKLQEAHAGLGALDAEARQTLDRLREAVQTSARAPEPETPAEQTPEPVAETPPPAAAEAAPAPTPAPPDENLPEVELVPAAELAPDARERLVRYLNDAWAVGKEQAGMLQQLIEATDDPDLRAELGSHLARGEHHQQEVEHRVRALGGEPAGGKGLLGQLVTRVWDALQKPRGDSDAVEAALQAVGAAEFEAGVYLAAHALARAAGDDDTAALTAAGFRAERGFARRLRERLTASVARGTRVSAEP